MPILDEIRDVTKNGTSLTPDDRKALLQRVLRELENASKCGDAGGRTLSQIPNSLALVNDGIDLLSNASDELFARVLTELEHLCMRAA